MLEGVGVVWYKDNHRHVKPRRANEVMFFYGAPELGKNMAWKKLDTEPTTHLNFYHKAKHFMSAQPIVMR